MADVTRFIRQFSHDLRNHLNAAELQIAYVNELASDAEIKGEITRVRGMLAELNTSLQRLTNALAEIKLTTMPYEAAAFVEDLRQKISAQFPEQAAKIDWEVDLGAAGLEIDPQILQQAMLEIFTNAFQHDPADGQMAASASIEDEQFVFTLREPKKTFIASTKDWGRRPFHTMKHGQYALGLPRVRGIIEGHRGQFSAAYDSSILVTTVKLPASRKS